MPSEGGGDPFLSYLTTKVPRSATFLSHPDIAGSKVHSLDAEREGEGSENEPPPHLPGPREPAGLALPSPATSQPLLCMRHGIALPITLFKH